MQPRRLQLTLALPHAPRRVLTASALAVALALALPGCTFPWQRAQESVDPDSNYESGAGAQLVVENDGNQTFDVKIWLRDPAGKIVGQSNFTLEPGEDATRRFATPFRGELKATIQYHFTGEGRASSGIDDRPLNNGDCDQLRSGRWTLTNLDKSAAAQWHDTGCVAP